MQAELTHRQVHVNGVDLHVVTAGEGPPVLLLHGFPDLWYGWRMQVDPLVNAGFSVVVPDLRGYNGSSKPKGKAAYRLRVLVDDVVGLIATTGHDKARIVGHDWGGIIAWATAMKRPDLVEKLVILNAPHPALLARALKDPRQLLRSSYAFFFQLPKLPERVLSARDFAAVRALLRRTSTRKDAFPPADLEVYIDALRVPGALTSALNYYRALLGRDGVRWARDKSRVQCPTLVLWGMQDPALGPWLLDDLDEVAPDLTVRRVENAGHFVQNDAPGIVNDALLSFLPGEDRLTRDERRTGDRTEGDRTEGDSSAV